MVAEFTANDNYYGSGSGSDTDPLSLKLITIGLDRREIITGSGQPFDFGSVGLDDFFGLGYTPVSTESVATSGDNLSPVQIENPGYEDTTYQDLTTPPIQTALPPATSTATPCKDCQDKPGLMGVEYWKDWFGQQAKNSRLITLGVLTLIIILAFRAGKHG